MSVTYRPCVCDVCGLCEDLVNGGSVVGGPLGAGQVSWISFLRLVRGRVEARLGPGRIDAQD